MNEAIKICKPFINIYFNYEITFIVFDDIVIFGDFDGDCERQKYRLN